MVCSARRGGLKVLDQAIDTSTPSGRLMFNMLGSIAQFERELMLESDYADHLRASFWKIQFFRRA